MRWVRKRGKRERWLDWRVSVACVTCLLGWAQTGWAVSKFFYEDGTIQGGESYSYVALYNDATVDMTGGEITWGSTTYNTSTFNLSGGFVEALVSVDLSSANLLGDVQVNGVQVHGSSMLNMRGGTVGIMEVGTEGGAYLLGGVISDYLSAGSTVDVYGYGFIYNPDAGDYGGGRLTGFWADDTPFGMDLEAFAQVPGGGSADTWPHIRLHEIPEPLTTSLLALGALLLRKRP